MREPADLIVDAMQTPKLIKVRGEPIAGGKHPLICTPLVGATTEAIEAELAVVLPKRPDIIEWRADFFREIASAERVIAMARAIRKRTQDVPLLFTVRWSNEGGQAIPLDDQGVISLMEQVSAAHCVDVLDYEMSHAPADVARVREATRRAGVTLFLSFHDFKRTPDESALLERFRLAERLGADVGKVAVMPQSDRDVLALLSATARARDELSIPILSMSMGALGSISRVAGWAFGSTLTFAVGHGTSAPGQIPIDELRTAIDIAQRAAGG